MPSITTDSIRLAERLSLALGAPPVRALHLPTPTGTKEAEFCALEPDDGW